MLLLRFYHNNSSLPRQYSIPIRYDTIGIFQPKSYCGPSLHRRICNNNIQSRYSMLNVICLFYSVILKVDFRTTRKHLDGETTFCVMLISLRFRLGLAPTWAIRYNGTPTSLKFACLQMTTFSIAQPINQTVWPFRPTLISC